VKTKEFKATIPALLFDPSFFVFDFAPNVELTKFLLVDENVLEQSPFVDVRFEPLSHAHFWVNTKELFALEGSHNIARPQPVYIFHHAFVCSTLLARCLNQIDAFFSLKEPWILRRLADFKRTHSQRASGLSGVMTRTQNYNNRPHEEGAYRPVKPCLDERIPGFLPT